MRRAVPCRAVPGSFVSDPSDPAFFLSEQGGRLTEWSIRWTFVKLSHEIGLRDAGDSRGPRLHDLRHRLAVSTLLHWYPDGIDVERHLPELSTYLGHGHITDTYRCLTATPELLRFALLRVEQSAQEPPYEFRPYVSRSSGGLLR
jgi:integrase/recombinase XerD